MVLSLNRSMGTTPFLWIHNLFSYCSASTLCKNIKYKSLQWYSYTINMHIQFWRLYFKYVKIEIVCYFRLSVILAIRYYYYWFVSILLFWYEKVRGIPKPRVTWYKNGELLQVTEKYTMDYTERGKCTLTVANSVDEDSGRYACEAINDQGRVCTLTVVEVIANRRLVEAERRLQG